MYSFLPTTFCENYHQEMEFAYSQVSERQEDDESSDNDDWFLIAHQSAGVGDIPSLMEAIKHDPSVLEYQDNEGMTPLTHAVAGRQLETMKLLVKMGASINMLDAQGRTPLSVAAYQGWYDGVVFLLRNGAKQHIADKTGRLPLHAATYDSDTRTISTLLSNLNMEEVNEQDNEGMTALHWASFHNRPGHVQLLMLKGSDIYSTDIDGKTPLHWASQNGSTQCCCVLVHCQSGGARLVNVIDNSGKSCVHLAAAAGHCEVLKELSQVKGVLFEAGDPDERTPLHWAAATGQTKCVQMLLDLKVDPSPKDCMGGTPLDYAKQSNHENAAKILLANGAEYGSMKPDVKEQVTTANSSKKPNTTNSGKKAKIGSFFTNLFTSKKKDKDSEDTPKESENVPERSHMEKTDSKVSHLDETQMKVNRVKPVIKTRASRISVVSTDAVGLSTQDGGLEDKSSPMAENDGMQQYTALDRRKNLPPLNEYHRELSSESHKSQKSAPTLQRQKQVFTTLPSDHLMQMNTLSPIPPLSSINKLKPTMVRSDDSVAAEETSYSLPNSKDNANKTAKHSLTKYSPLPSPVAMRRGHSDPTSDNGSNGNLTGVKLRPLGRQMYNVAAHVETSSQEILAAQREPGERRLTSGLYPLRSISPSALSGCHNQGATPHGSPKLAPLKLPRPKRAGYSYPPSGRCLSNPSTFQSSASEDKTEDEDEDNPNRPRSKSLQTTSDDKTSGLPDKTAIAAGLCHSKSVDPLLLPVSSPSAGKSHKKKKKKSKHKRAASLEEMKKNDADDMPKARRPSDHVNRDDFHEPPNLRREATKAMSTDTGKFTTRPGYIQGKQTTGEQYPELEREHEYSSTAQNTNKQIGLTS